MKEILIGIVQGITEFLPVSSSGHIVLMKHFSGIKEVGISLEVTLHLATLLAIIVFYWRRMCFYLKPKRLAILIISSIPAGVVGILFREKIASLFIFPILPYTFLFTSIFLLLSEKKEKERSVDIRRGFVIGIAQALAILPGISRSGLTIGTALLLGIKKEEAMEFSFFLAIPAIIGAGIVDLKEIKGNFYPFPFIAAFIFGILSLYFLRRMVIQKKLRFFSFYLLPLSLLLFVLR